LPGPFYAALLWAISATLGIFLSADIFLFLVFWELALLPIYFMLMVHSQEARSQALRFILFTQLSGLFLLIAIVSLAFTHYEHSSVLTFDYQQLIFGNFSATEQFYLLGLFLLAFLLKLPAFPVHSWLVGIFVHMPLPALLVGILVKTAVFGLLRFSWVLFPLGSLQWALPMMILGACGLIYGAILAFGQDDSKKVLAYGNLSHVGLLLIGVFCHNESSYFGVLLLLICQALSSGGLMILLDKLGDDAHGLWSSQTKLSAFLLVLVMASIGLPGFGNFVGEWLILSGSFAENSMTSLLACSGIVLGALYSLKLFQKIAWPNKTKAPYLSCDLGAADLSTLSFIVVLLVTLGCYPNIIFKLANPQNFSSLKN
jgi:NADH-quinone oxidoreductase subunit M